MSADVIGFLAAVVGAAMNSIAGGGTLVTFPALLWLGLDARVANATSAAVMWPASLSAAWAYRSSLAGSRSQLSLLGVPSILGGVCGAWLLLRTPSAMFKELVPYLVLFATLLFMASEPLGKLRRPLSQMPVAALLAQFATALYGGYFGAGMGILMLTTFTLLGEADIHRANGIKSILAACINAVAVAAFICSGLVDWSHAGVMIAGAILGGWGGAGLGQKLGPRFVRAAVIVIGLAISVVLFLNLKG